MIKRHLRCHSGEVFRIGLIILIVLPVLLNNGTGIAPNVFAETGDLISGEYKIKAVYLYNFLKFTEWTNMDYPDTCDTIRITILGEDPFGEAFDPLEGRTIKGKTLQITRISSIQNLGTCHLLFISSSEKNYLERTFKVAGDSRMLTVGETEQFAQLGGIIGFFIEEDAVQFAINLTAADRAGIKFSSQLLQIAKIVRNQK